MVQFQSHLFSNNDDNKEKYFDLYTNKKLRLNQYIDYIIKTIDFRDYLFKNRSVNILRKTFNIHIFTSFPDIQDNTYTRNT